MLGYSYFRYFMKGWSKGIMLELFFKAGDMAIEYEVSNADMIGNKK